MSLRFAVLAILALLTKANAGALVLLPVPAAFLAGRSDLFRRRSFWLPVPLVVLFAGPWYVFYAWLMANLSKVPLTPEIASSYLLQGLGIFGLATIPLVLAGIGSGFFKRAPAAVPHALWAVAVSMSLGFIAYYCVIPGGFEPRYILMAAPWVAILLVAGAEWIAMPFLPSQPRVVPAVLLAAVVLYGAATFYVRPKPQVPYAEVAYDLVCRDKLPQSVFLISSESTVETVFVAEVAMRDRRPNHFVFRASKMLARMNWNGNRYETTVDTAAQVSARLRALGVSRIIIDTTKGPIPRPDHQLLRSTVANDPEWRLARRYGPLEVYAFVGVVKMPARIQVDVPYTLRRTLAAETGK
jgi:hypothetical protein